jgi:predicted acetyltransferase
VSTLQLRALTVDDESWFTAAHEQMMIEGFTFGLGFDVNEPWRSYLTRLDEYQLGQVGEWVPMTFLVADVDGHLVGRTSIRHRLNEFLAHEGGHIGYGVVPDQRRKGYATEILRLSLAVARDVGVQRALVTCDDDNVGSATVIERCGGQYDSVVTSSDGSLVRRYWIDCGHDPR